MTLHVFVLMGTLHMLQGSNGVSWICSFPEHLQQPWSWSLYLVRVLLGREVQLLSGGMFLGG